MSTYSIVGAIPEVYYRRVWQAVQWSWLKIEAINFVLTKWPVSSSNPISSIIKWGKTPFSNSISSCNPINQTPLR